MGVVFAGKLVYSVHMLMELSYTVVSVFPLLWVWSLLVIDFFCEYETKLHWNVYILFTVHVVFVGRLVCSVNVLYMEL